MATLSNQLAESPYLLYKSSTNMGIREDFEAEELLRRLPEKFLREKYDYSVVEEEDASRKLHLQNAPQWRYLATSSYQSAVARIVQRQIETRIRQYRHDVQRRKQEIHESITSVQMQIGMLEQQLIDQLQGMLDETMKKGVQGKASGNMKAFGPVIDVFPSFHDDSIFQIPGLEEQGEEKEAGSEDQKRENTRESPRRERPMPEPGPVHPDAHESVTSQAPSVTSQPPSVTSEGDKEYPRLIAEELVGSLYGTDLSGYGLTSPLKRTKSNTYTNPFDEKLPFEGLWTNDRPSPSWPDPPLHHDSHFDQRKYRSRYQYEFTSFPYYPGLTPLPAHARPGRRVPDYWPEHCPDLARADQSHVASLVTSDDQQFQNVIKPLLKDSTRKLWTARLHDVERSRPVASVMPMMVHAPVMASHPPVMTSHMAAGQPIPVHVTYQPVVAMTTAGFQAEAQQQNVKRHVRHKRTPNQYVVYDPSAQTPEPTPICSLTPPTSQQATPPTTPTNEEEKDDDDEENVGKPLRKAPSTKFMGHYTPADYFKYAVHKIVAESKQRESEGEHEDDVTADDHDEAPPVTSYQGFDETPVPVSAPVTMPPPGYTYAAVANPGYSQAYGKLLSAFNMAMDKPKQNQEKTQKPKTLKVPKPQEIRLDHPPPNINSGFTYTRPHFIQPVVQPVHGMIPNMVKTGAPPFRAPRQQIKFVGPPPGLVPARYPYDVTPAPAQKSASKKSQNTNQNHGNLIQIPIEKLTKKSKSKSKH